MTQFGLGRIAAPDSRDHKFLLRSVTPTEPRPKRKTWTLKERLNQGSTPQCVGFSWTHFLLAAPTRQANKILPADVYRGAQENDEWDGEDYEGSSVRGGAKFLTDVKHLVHSYSWAFGLEELLNAVGHLGPVVIGINWYSQMFDPNHENIVSIGSSSVAGGHATLILGYSDTKELVLIHNSWGQGWGDNGRAWISYEDLSRLIHEDGEACMALERAPK